jgi:cytochrome bd ubiquinol oxidase subunit II
VPFRKKWGAVETILADIWLFLIGFFLLYYAVSDGSDLGIGIISLFAGTDRGRSLLMASIASTWHDNQTWLVLLGGMLFGAFPVFYSLVLSSLYIPITAMLFGLVFRGVAFEFREHSQTHKRVWGISFGLGSLLVTLAQGFALGGLLGGLESENGRFTGSVWGWLHPYGALVASGVLFGYVMLGANYLILKTEGTTQQESFRWSWASSLTTLFISAAVHLATAARYPFLVEKYAQFPAALLIWTPALLATASFAMLLLSLKRRSERGPLLFNILVILFSFAALSAGMYPNMIPNVIASPVTVQAAAASPKTLTFMLAMALVLIPLILAYTAYKHRIFKGKVRESSYGG